MNQNPTSQYGQYAIVLLFGIFLSFVACAKATDPPETDEGEKPPKTDEGEKPPKPLYAKDAILRIGPASEGYTYLARVTEDTRPDAQNVPVHVFTEYTRKKTGDTVPIGDVHSIREEPPNGWGTRSVAAEYFDGTQWNFEWSIQEMEDHYLLPETFQGVRRLEFSSIRFPIPIQR